MPKDTNVEFANADFENVYESEPVEPWTPAVGESLIGTYMGRDTVTAEDPDNHELTSFSYHLIRDVTGAVVRISESYQIAKAFDGRSIANGTRIKLTYTGDQTMSKAGRSPMKCYSLAVAKGAAVAAS
jgi:hypothetical protein